jgi:hypothetical protein
MSEKLIEELNKEFPGHNFALKGEVETGRRLIIDDAETTIVLSWINREDLKSLNIIKTDEAARDAEKLLFQLVIEEVRKLIG